MPHRGRSTALVFALAFAILLVPPALKAQSLSIEASPVIALPLGACAQTYGTGAGADLDLAYGLASQGKAGLLLEGGLGYLQAPLPATGKALSILSLGLGGGLNLALGEKLRLKADAKAGYYLSFYDSQTGGSAFLDVNLGASYRLAPSLALGLGASWTDYLSGLDPFYQGLGLSLRLSWSPVPERHLPRLDLPAPELSPVFPVFHKYLDTHPLGKLSLRNGEDGPVTALVVTFYVKEFMDAPKTCAQIPSLARGEELSVPLYALLKDSILNITEETKVQATVKVSYTYQGQRIDVERTESLRVYHRNAMTWEDDSRAAAFVTAKDPMVLKLAKGVNAIVRDDPNPSISLNFRLALGLFEELGRLGLRYTVNPGGSYAEYEVNKYTVDYLQFPRQTLEYKGGDCSDLSILYSALLEALGIETAFITVPGHIFLAFDPGLSRIEAREAFSSAQDLIEWQGRVWIPVEITLVKDGFLPAWREGSREWRESMATRAFYPIREAWKTYEPVWVPGEAGSLGEVPRQEFGQRFAEVLGSFAEREVAARAGALKAEIAAGRSSPTVLNRLGVLYARYGLLAKAQAQFEAAAKAGKGKTILAPLVNLGNLAFLKKDWVGAYTSYEKARQVDPASPGVLLGLAKVDYERENYGTAKALYEQALALQPSLAERYSYLGTKGDETSRAASADLRASVMWGE